ncbi:MAG: substrate-binding domain-containing protein, partial [Oscillospiraceae bacterium]|nr:substrate-binding domain-containing protein [Oscillospiraceae bacterium]
MKKIIALLLALMMIVGLVACGAQEEVVEETEEVVEEVVEETEEVVEETEEVVEDGAPVIAFVPKVIGQAWWDYVHTGVDAWAAETGYDVIYKGPAEVDAAAQVQIMTDMVNQGVDILCFSPNDPAACEEICKQAR